MRKLSIAALAAAAAFASPAFGATQDFTVLNGTGKTIAQVFVSASAKEKREEDVLGAELLPEGERARIRFSNDENSCLWDLRVAYRNGETAEWHGIDLCQGSVVKLSQDDDGDTYAETE